MIGQANQGEIDLPVKVRVWNTTNLQIKCQIIGMKCDYLPIENFLATIGKIVFHLSKDSWVVETEMSTSKASEIISEFVRSEYKISNHEFEVSVAERTFTICGLSTDNLFC